MHSGPIFGAFFSGWTVARILQEVLSQEPCLQRVVVFLHQHDVFLLQSPKCYFSQSGITQVMSTSALKQGIR